MPESWVNWSGNQSCAPERIERPGSEAEVIEVVRRAADEGRRVRVAGSGHSFTDIVCTDGVLVDLSRMGAVLEADTETGRVTVEAGIKLHALGGELAARGLALENQGDIDAQAVAGATATATHGTGARFPNISARVVGMRLVTGSGEVVEVNEDSDPEGLLAAKVSVGALGVATTVTMQCVPLYTLHRRDEPRPLAETLDRLDELVDGNDHFEFFVFPYASTALTRRTERGDHDIKREAAWKLWVQEELLENKVLEVLCRTGRRYERLVPRLNRFITSAASAGEKTDHAYKVYASKRAVRFNEMEYAIPRAAGREAVERVLELVERRRLPIAFPLEVRFATGDEAFLSTAHGRDTCYVAVHQFQGMEYESYFRAVEEIMDSYDGRPHWGKRHYQSAATLAPRYPGWDRFQAVRARFDPEGLFTNDYTRRALGPVGVAAAEPEPAPAPA